MKTSILFLLFALLPLFTFSQKIKSIALGSSNYQVNLGDTVVVGLPAGTDHQFLFISSDTSKEAMTMHNFDKIDKSSSVVRSVSSKEFVETAASRHAGKDGESSNIGSVWIRSENPLTNKVLKIVRFEEFTNSEGKQHFFAIAKADTNRFLRIDLEQAIYAGEISEHQGRIFETFRDRISRPNNTP